MARSLNLLALPKDPAIMRVFKAPPGMTLGQFDLRTVEPRVLAHYAQDPKMLAICGKGGFQNHCIYLVGGMGVPDLGDRIKAIYDFNNPTISAVAEAKRKFKVERAGMLKPGFLGWQYGLGAATFSTKSGLSVSQARDVLIGFNRAFPGKDALQKRLEVEWAKNGGYIVNGRGLPMAVDFGSKKDLVSRFVQGTAHTVLLRLLFHINAERTKRRIPSWQMRPYICDIHDESVWAMIPEMQETFREIVDLAFERVNAEFCWDVSICHSGVNFGPTLEIRCEE